MNLHHDTESFKDLIELTARMFNIPSASIAFAETYCQ